MPNQDEPNVDMKELFNMPFHYQLHSYTQKKQAEFLIFLIKQYVKYFNIKPKLILDVGCGTGAITKCIWRDHFPDARIIGVDISESMITKAIEDLPRNYNIEYLCSSIEDFQYPNKFDVAFTNATMHWIKNQEVAYESIHNLMEEKSILVVHQGHKGCYKELIEVARKVITNLDFSQRFGDFFYPLVYHTKDSIKNLLDKTGFKLVQAHTFEFGMTDTLVDDFVEAALLPYRKRLKEKEEKNFIKEFKKEAKTLTEIDTTRLYFVARKK